MKKPRMIPSMFLASLLLLFACAPVLNKDLMKEGARNVPFDEITANQDANKGKLFILGGFIVETRFTAYGSQMEVLSVPVGSRGYLEENARGNGRFLAIYPKEKGFLDPVVYKKGRQVTLAGQFTGLKNGKIDEMDYIYPVFEIRQIHMFEEQNYNAPPYPYYYSYPYPYPFWSYPGPWPPPPGWWW